MKTSAACLALALSVAPIPDQRLSGKWGGPHVGLDITTEGGTVQFDCAHGDISQGVFLDRNSRFTAFGTYVDEHQATAGKSEAKTFRVSYSGRVSGTHMTLTVTRTDTKARIGDFTADRGKEPTLTKCK